MMKTFHPMSFLGPVISSIIVWVIVRNIDFSFLKLSFIKVNPFWILIMVLVYILGFIMRGIRWRIMLQPIKKVSSEVATQGVIVGYMANNILPARAGELVRAYFIGNIESISKMSSLGTIFIERVFDGLVIVGILIGSSIFLKFSDVDQTVVNSVIIFGSLIFCISILFIFFCNKYGEHIENYGPLFLSKLSPKAARLSSSIITRFIRSLKFLDAAGGLAAVFLISVCIWLIEGLVFFAGFYAFQLTANLPIAYFTFAFVNLGMIIPSAPGGVGIFQGASILALSYFGISSETALGYSVVVHSVMFIPITVIGLFIINRYGLSIWKLRNG